MTLERRITTSNFTNNTTAVIWYNNPASNSKFPPYDLIAIDEYRYSIVLAVAGYKKENIKISVDKNILIIKGKWEDKKVVDKPAYSVNGIAKRDFSLDFRLGEYVEVASAKTEDGLLTIEVIKNVPEEKKPKVIEIE